MFISIYFKAFSFRQSNYFVLYFSQSLGILSSLESFSSKGTEEFNQVVEQSKIELPRSLVHVVTNWNIPMHNWLKKCKNNLFRIQLFVNTNNYFMF
jgi:porcupine-like protein